MDPELLKRYPLPDGVDDAELNRTQLSVALSIAEVTVDRWVREGMPVAEHGTNGKAYKFLLSHCWAWRKDRDAQAAEAKAAADKVVEQMRLALLGGEEGETEMALPPKERLAVYEAEQRYMAAARARGDLIRVDEVVALVEDLFLMFRDSLDALPDVLERDVNLTADQVTAAIGTCDDMVQQLRTRIERAHLGEPPDEKPGSGAGAYMS